MTWYNHLQPIVRANSNDINIWNEQSVYAPLGLSDYEIILDCGAHTGAFAAWARYACGVRGSIHCYEPHPHNMQLLKLNNELLHLNAVPMYGAVIKSSDASLTNIPTIKTLFVNSQNTGMHSLLPRSGQIEMIVVPTFRFDKVLASHITAMKIDIELFEYYLDITVIAERPNLKKIALEYHFSEHKDYTGDAIWIHDFLQGQGFVTVKPPDFSHAEQTIGIYRRE